MRHGASFFAVIGRRNRKLYKFKDVPTIFNAHRQTLGAKVLVFANRYILQQTPTLIVHIYFFQVVLYVLFVAQKAPKTPVTGKISHNSLLLTSRRATSLGRLLFATNSSSFKHRGQNNSLFTQ